MVFSRYITRYVDASQLDNRAVKYGNKKMWTVADVREYLSAMNETVYNWIKNLTCLHIE